MSEKSLRTRDAVCSVLCRSAGETKYTQKILKLKDKYK